MVLQVGLHLSSTYLFHFLSAFIATSLSHGCISQLPNLFGGTPRICNCIFLLIMWVRSFSKRLPSVTFTKEKVLIFLIPREKAKIVQL